uniref:Uncharacterized protein n=1 Tax=viral metagenome TaxID=1070528 RepID=A0A6H2A0E3_9ZZZZ
MAMQILEKGSKDSWERDSMGDHMGDHHLNLGDDLYDDALGYDDETGVRLPGGLTPEERVQAIALYRLFNELWGVCIVKGDPGTGKDLFGNYLAWKIKRFFPHKRVLRDEKPRKLFGPYAGLFNEAVLHSDLAKMRELAKGVGAVRLDIIMEKAADDWVTGAGQVLLKNSLLYLTEFWRYCYNREPHNPMNKTMGAIHKMKRHLDCLILGTVQLPSELDKKTCLPWVDWVVTCTRSSTNRTGFVYYVQKVTYDRRRDYLIPLGRPFPIAFDAGKPRSDLGDGRIVIRRRTYKPENEEERIVLDIIKAGLDTYEDIVALLETEGDMDEAEVLDTLKALKFRKQKRAVDYPCFFGIYNSKSAPNITTRIKVED